MQSQSNPIPPEVRTTLATLRAQLREYASDIEMLKLGIRENLLVTFDGDPKRLGSNEQLRADTYERAYLGNAELQRIVKGQREAQAQLDQFTAELDSALDVVKAQRLDADNRRTTAIYAALEIDPARLVAIGALA